MTCSKLIKNLRSNLNSVHHDINEKMMEFERLYNEDPKDGYREGKYKRFYEISK